MGTQDQARALMMRHRHTIKNRQQSLLNRVADEVGIEPNVPTVGDRNNAAMS